MAYSPLSFDTSFNGGRDEPSRNMSISVDEADDVDAIKPLPRISAVRTTSAQSQRSEDAIQTQPQVSDSTVPLSPGKPDSTKKEPPLRYRRRTIWILIFYLPLLIIPWTLTCVLAVRPFNIPSYIVQWGGFSAQEWLSIMTWLGAIKVLNSIAGVVTIPIISTLLAQAAVVYCQRRKEKQSLSVRQVFALADRGWSDVPILWGSWGSNQKGTSSRFLWLATLLLLISAIQQPIQSGLVTYVIQQVMTCIDEPIYSCDPMHFPITVAYDPEPADMATLPQNLLVQEVASGLVTISEYDVQPRMWVDHPYVDPDLTDSYSDPAWRRTFFWNFNPLVDTENITRDTFVTILENGTTTGVLREHAMRFNSSVQCNSIPNQDFPSTCPGRRPFEASFSQPGYLEINVCVPGEFGVTPWNNTRDRQDIQESLFLDVSIWPYSVSNNAFGFNETNFTVHCTANSTRGYFEIGNYRNNYTYGPLVEQWPSPEEMAYEWNDHLGALADYAKPSREDPSSWGSLLDWGPYPPDPFGTSGLIASGPLMTSAIAMFGNESFFYVASNASAADDPPALVQICQEAKFPFSRFGLLMFDDFQSLCGDWEMQRASASTDNVTMEENVEELAGLLWAWVANFQDPDISKEALTASMFLSNQAVLTVSSSATMDFGARWIYTSDGLPILRPFMTLAGKIIISTLIGLQLIGIALVVRYIYKVPTWTPALDALAVARMGRAMGGEGDLPPIGPVSDKERQKLTKMDGLVGVAGDDGEEEENKEGTEAPGATQSAFRLGLGAPGLIHRGLAPRKLAKKKKRWAKWFGRGATTKDDKGFYERAP